MNNYWSVSLCWCETKFNHTFIYSDDWGVCARSHWCDDENVEVEEFSIDHQILFKRWDKEGLWWGFLGYGEVGYMSLVWGISHSCGCVMLIKGMAKGGTEAKEGMGKSGNGEMRKRGGKC